MPMERAIYFIFYLIYLRESESVRAPEGAQKEGGGAEGEGKNLKHTLLWLWSPQPWDHDPSQNLELDA